jgi:putative transposase
LTAGFLQSALEEAGVRRHNGIYSPLVILWLLVWQRLEGGAPLETAVLELLRGLPASFWPRPCKRMRDWWEHGKAPSSNTGAYNQARQALPVSVVQKSCDRIFEELVAQFDRPGSRQRRRTFLLDGTTMRAAHTPALCQTYPPGSNQYREGHWPLLRVLVAHDIDTGLAMRPEWGPVHGPDPVSEQALLQRALDRLPSGATVLGDCNFGIFSVAYDADQRQHPVLLRLTSVRAQRLAGEPLRDRINRRITWRPTRDDRRRHPELPPDACVTGRLIVRRVQPDDGAEPFLLALFTTLDAQEKELLGTYGQRWKIETDLRTLKGTLRLDQLTSATPEMVAKEIDMGIAAYNLVRAVTCLASEQSGIPPRGYSFTRVLRIVETFTPLVAAASDPQQAKRAFDQMMRCVQQAKLPRRRRRRHAYPRKVWNRGEGYPKRQD